LVTSPKTVIAAVKKPLQELSKGTQGADQSYILCCIRNLSNEREMRNIALGNYLAIMRPRFPVRMVNASFLKQQVPCHRLEDRMLIPRFPSSYFADGIDKGRVLGWLASVNMVHLASNFRLTNTHVYLTNDCYSALQASCRL
jgi:hypothetical protein